MAALPQSGYRAPSSAEFWFEGKSQVFTSPLTGAEQRLDLWGKWHAVLTWENLEPDEAMPLVAFFTRHRTSTAFTMYDPARTALRGAGGGTPLVNGGSQTGQSLITDGWPNSTLVLKAGDLIGYVNPSGRNELYEVYTDATSNGSGELTIALANPIRNSPANNAAILTGTSALVQMRLDRPVRHPTAPPILRTFTAEMSEDY